MKILITGGAGFLGARLARTILSRGHLRGEPVDHLLLADLVAPPPDLLADPRVHSRAGDLLELCGELRPMRFDLCFHLASALSGACESDFDLGMRSNVDTTRALIDALRASGNLPGFIFASSVAVFGSDPYLPLPSLVHDETLPTPQSSYGTQKFICEQMIADYTRKGFVDGRAARLMTVVVRPGRPNSAASGFLSSIIREPLNGEAAVCPVPLESAVAIASPHRAIQGLIAVAEADRDALGGRTALNLPALTVRVGEMLEALRQVGGQSALDLVRFVPDANVARIVGGWPSTFDNSRAERLGLTPDRDILSVVHHFQEDQRKEFNHG